MMIWFCYALSFTKGTGELFRWALYNEAPFRVGKKLVVTHSRLVNSSIVANWTSLFSVLGYLVILMPLSIMMPLSS